MNSNDVKNTLSEDVLKLIPDTHELYIGPTDGRNLPPNSAFVFRGDWVYGSSWQAEHGEAYIVPKILEETANVPEGFKLYEGKFDWAKLPTGSAFWNSITKEWIFDPKGGLCACPYPEARYAVPIVSLPEMPAQPAPQLDILEEALDLIRGDRAASYGKAQESFERIAAAWTVYLKHKLKPSERVSPSDVARLMIALKLSRSISSAKRDNWTDMAGYASLAAEIEAHEAAPE